MDELDDTPPSSSVASIDGDDSMEFEDVNFSSKKRAAARHSIFTPLKTTRTARRVTGGGLAPTLLGF